MTWEEHEREFCREIEPRPEDLHERNPMRSWADAENYIECYQMGYEEGNIFQLCAVRWDQKYWIVHLLSNEAELYYTGNCD